MHIVYDIRFIFNDLHVEIGANYDFAPMSMIYTYNIMILSFVNYEF